VIAMDSKDEAKIRHFLQEAIDKSRTVIKDSKEKKLFCLAVDWLQVL